VKPPRRAPVFTNAFGLSPQAKRSRFVSTGRTSRRKVMRILFLTTAHNRLSQRLRIELVERGHDIRVCVAATSEAMFAGGRDGRKK
jgi:hypothetical protein